MAKKGQQLDQDEVAGVLRGMADIAAGRVRSLDEIDRPDPPAAATRPEERLVAALRRYECDVDADEPSCRSNRPDMPEVWCSECLMQGAADALSTPPDPLPAAQAREVREAFRAGFVARPASALEPPEKCHNGWTFEPEGGMATDLEPRAYLAWADLQALSPRPSSSPTEE